MQSGQIGQSVPDFAPTGKRLDNRVGLGHTRSMNIDWKSVLTALGLVCVIEGLPYFLFAEKMPRTLRAVALLPPRVLRLVGGVALVCGVVLVALARR